MRYARIEGSTVVDVVEQDAAPTITGDWVECGSAGPGWLHVGGVFSPPAQPRHITQLAFLNRFTDAEAVAIDLASIGATAQAASMRRYLNKVSAAEYIDLERAETRAGVLALESAGLLAAGRALVILDSAVATHEVFKK